MPPVQAAVLNLLNKKEKIGGNYLVTQLHNARLGELDIQPIRC